MLIEIIHFSVKSWCIAVLYRVSVYRLGDGLSNVTDVPNFYFILPPLCLYVQQKLTNYGNRLDYCSFLVNFLIDFIHSGGYLNIVSSIQLYFGYINLLSLLCPLVVRCAKFFYNSWMHAGVYFGLLLRGNFNWKTNQLQQQYCRQASHGFIMLYLSYPGEPAMTYDGDTFVNSSMWWS